MQSPAWLIYSAAWLATVALILLTRHFCRRHLRLPPGPKPWPIIGNLHLIGALPHRSLDALSQKHGPLMQLQLGSFPAVVASSAEMAKAILKTHDLAFAGRPETAAGKYTTYNYSDIAWSQYGPYWRQARKICATELFSAKRLDSSESIRVEELKLLLRGLYESRGSPISLKARLSDLALNSLSRIVLGRKYAVKREGEREIVSPEEFKEMLDELFLLNGVLDIGDLIPWLRFLDLQGNIRRMKALGKRLDRFFDQVIDEHDRRRKSTADFQGKDLVDVLLELVDDPSLEVKIERIGIKGFTQDLIAGGTESPSVTVEWAISELLKKTEIFEKATEELDRVIGRDRWVEEKDMVNLPYINAIMKETMRLRPSGTLLVPRLCREDTKIEGYDIPKGTRVLINVWSIGRDPKIWDNPNEFRPERFIDREIDIKGNNFELLPFGAGRRMCPGYLLGLKMLQSSLANLLHGFNWELHGDMTKEELNTEEIFGLSTPRKFPLIVVAEPRLPSHVYSL